METSISHLIGRWATTFGTQTDAGGRVHQRLELYRMDTVPFLHEKVNQLTPVCWRWKTLSQASFQNIS